MRRWVLACVFVAVICGFHRGGKAMLLLFWLLCNVCFGFWLGGLWVVLGDFNSKGSW